MLGMIRTRGQFVLRKVQGQLSGCAQFGLQGQSMVSFTRDASGNGSSLAVMGLIVLVMIAVIAMLGQHSPDHSHLLSLVGVAGITAKKSGTDEKKPANIRAMESNVKALARELEQGQIEMAAGPITQERGEELEQKAQEMEELQAHVDRYNKIAGITSNARKMERVTLPGETESIQSKRIVTTPGHLFVASEAFEQFKNAGRQIMSGWSGKVSTGRRLGKRVQLTGEEAAMFEKKAFDPATLSNLGTDAIIAVDRDPEIVRFAEPEILTIRDVLNTTPTTSDAIRFVRHTATARAAGTQTTRGGLKQYLHITFEPQTVSVETIAVLSKVTEQDVSDSPRLVAYINGEMNLDVKVEEERQIVWGSGTNELSGIFDPDNDVPEFNRAEAGDTVIDTIRRMRTDLRKKRVQPTFVAIDPIDWEEVELAKGTDARYVWGLITDMRGPRIWSLNVVESDAMTNPVTEERRLLVGDGIRGATLYDREQVQLAVGFVDDDFARNLRTLRAEERLALAVKRPWAFEFAVTAEAQS